MNHECIKCEQKTSQEKKGMLTYPQPQVGNVTVYNVTYEKCSNCGKIFFPMETFIALCHERQKILDSWIISQPMNQFLSSRETAIILNVTPQFLSKNKKIKQGLIFQAKKGKSTYYFKKSVEQYKKTGDGCFDLPKEELLLLQQEEKEEQKTKHGLDIVLD